MNRSALLPWPLRVGLGAAIALLGSSDWRMAVLALGGALACRVWPPAARGIVAMLAANVASTQSPLGLATLGLVFIPFERRLGRSVLTVGLLLAAAPGVWASYRAFAVADLAGDDAKLEPIIDLAHRAGLRNLEGRLRLEAARELMASHSTDAALATLSLAPEPREPEVELGLADLEVAAGHLPQARFRLARLAGLAPSTSAPLLPLTAELWSRALLRRDHRPEALAALTGVDTPEATRLHDQAVLPSRASRSAESGTSFSGAIRLVEIRGPDHCATRGLAAPFTWIWDVEEGFSPSESDYVFLHAYGPGTVLSGDHLIAGRHTDSLVPGERLVDSFNLWISPGAASGTYHINLGIYDPANELRLLPTNRPEHESFTEGGTFRVCP